MNNTTAKLVTVIAAAALLAGCGGGSSSSTSLPSTPSQVSQPTQPVANKVTTGLAIKVDIGSKKSQSKARSSAAPISKRPNQITPDVTDLVVTVDGTPTDFVLATSPYCSNPTPGNYVCSIAASVGSHTVSVATNNGSATTVGYSLPQGNINVAPLAVTNVSFTLTPVASGFSGSWVAATNAGWNSLPEDGNTYGVNVTADVLAMDGSLISTPIDNVNLFGTVTVSTAPNSYSVSPPTQTNDPNYGVYNDSPYSFNYDGSEISGDQLVVNNAYTKNTTTQGNVSSGLTQAAYNGAVTASSNATAFLSIPLTRLELPNNPNPAGATLNGSVFDSSNSWYYIPPSQVQPEPNGTTDAVVVFNNVNPNQNSFTLIARATNDTSQATVSGTCSTASGTGGTIYSIGAVVGSTNGVTPITIQPPTVSGQDTGTPCTLTVANGSFSTLTQSVTIYPSTQSLNVHVHLVHRT